MCSIGYCHAFLLSTAGVVGLELNSYNPTTPQINKYSEPMAFLAYYSRSGSRQMDVSVLD